MGVNMAGFGKELVYCLLAVLLASASADDKVTRDIETKESLNPQKSEVSRSGAYYASDEESFPEHADLSQQQLFYGPEGAGSAYSYNALQRENAQHGSQFSQGNLGHGPGSVPYLPQYQYRLQEPNYNQGIEVITRPIPHSEYYWPNKDSGYETAIHCQREGELHSFWTPVHDCMLCVCVRDGPYLEPVCVNCAGCIDRKPFPAPVPVSMTTLLPIYIETTPVPEPVPEPVPDKISCSPMPTETPFQNPLHPCQICICYEALDVHGETDVKIECQENPQCVLPPEPLPPIVYDEPAPLPKCKKFPNNVLFPHPVEPCKLCKCSVQTTRYGNEDLITCFPDPDCALPPTPHSHVIPPVTSRPKPAPVPVPSPLPGPSPHESCRPYTPNQPFQHPWDECQTCVCIESFSVGIITIEINCYTNKICCIEPPFDETVASPVYPYGPVPGYGPGGQQQQISETSIQEQDQQNYALHKQLNQIGSQVSVPYSYQKQAYNNFITAKPGFGYVPGYGQNPNRVNYGPLSYPQGTYSQNSAYDESEPFDKNLNYDHKAYQQGNYAPGIYSSGSYAPVIYNKPAAYAQSSTYDESEHFDKNLNHDQKSYQKGNYAPGVYNPSIGQVLIGYNGGAYGQSSTYGESEHQDKSLNSAHSLYSQGSGGNYGQTGYNGVAYGQSSTYGESELLDKNLNSAQSLYSQGSGGNYGQKGYNGVAYSQSSQNGESENFDTSVNSAQSAYSQGLGGNYGQKGYNGVAYSQSSQNGESENFDKSLNLAQSAYSQGSGGNYGQKGYNGVAYSQSSQNGESENFDKSVNSVQSAYSQGLGGNYGQKGYNGGAYGQSSQYGETENFDKSVNSAQSAYSQGPGGNYGQKGYNGVAYGQSSQYGESENFDKSVNSAQNSYGQGFGNSNTLRLKFGPVQLSLKGKTKSADPNIQDASDEQK